MKSGKLLGRELLNKTSEMLPVYPDFNGKRILAVDDNAVNREVLKDVLHNLGAGVTLAISGEEAIELAKNASYDLIFMDCSMPGIDGFEATKLIRVGEKETGIRTPIVALTAHVSGDQAARWKVSEMDGYLSKPFTIEGIVGVLSQYMEANEQPTEPEKPKVHIDFAADLEDEDPVDLSNIDIISPKTLELLARLEANGTNDVANKIFGMYLEHSKLGLLDLKSAFSAKSATQLAMSAHSLKSMSHSAGALKVAQICNMIEKLAGDGATHVGIDQFELLASALGETVQAMQTRMAKAA